VNGVSNVIQGNYIGTDAAGTHALPGPPDAESGLIGGFISGVYDEGQGTVIGGLALGAGNVISGIPGVGSRLGDGSALVQGNLIGTDASGNDPLPNETGIWDQNGRDTIGGTALGAGNTIAFNELAGVVVSGTGTLIEGNSIYGNSRIGIDLPPPTNRMGLSNSASTRTRPTTPRIIVAATT
jgi:hypothetical protein